MDLGKCRGCGEHVYWVRLKKSGKNTPLNKRRIIVVTQEGEIVSGYEDHFSTCPQASLFRRAPKRESA